MELKQITRQALPDSEYLELLGISLCVFNSNNSFMIENIIRQDDQKKNDWYRLIDQESGKLRSTIQDTIGKHKYGSQAETLFMELVDMRNRIIHSFQITYDGKQMLATKEHNKFNQFRITEEYLRQFIKKNEEMSDLLYKIRGDIKP